VTRKLLRGVVVLTALVAVRRIVAAEPAVQTILNTESLWRVRLVFEPEEILLPSGKVDHVRLKFHKGQSWRTMKVLKNFDAEKLTFFRLPPETSPDWITVGFDDSTWARGRGPFLAHSQRVNWKLLLMRGRFEVTDPETVQGLTLSVAYKGGVVVYLNGERIARAHMPAVAARERPEDVRTMYSPALPDRDEAFLYPDGYLAHIPGYWAKRPENVAMRAARIRTLSGLKIPAARLRKGANVLAIAIHRAPARWEYYATRVKPWPYGAIRSAYSKWCRLALHTVNLIAPAGEAVTSDVKGARGTGLVAWNQSILRKVYASDYASSVEPLRPVRIAGVRNGTFAGQVVVSAGGALNGITARVSDLKGPGTIGASAVEVRYGVPDGHHMREKKPWYDSLSPEAPAEVPALEEGGAAIQPLWIRVAVPKDAVPGAYQGTVTVRADGAGELNVPLHLDVMDWALPDPNDYVADMDFFQSPDTVAMQYKVPFWSKKHWALMDTSFALMRPLAAKTVYITCVRRTQLGNEHAMVRWVRTPDGSLEPDLSLAEKYLDMAVRHLGRIPGVILYVWEPTSSEGEYGWRFYANRTHDREILISVLDPDTGELFNEKGPRWGTPECRTFWRTLVRAMKASLDRRGMGDSLMFGLLGDHRATKTAMDDMTAASREVKWAVHSHDRCSQWQGYDVGMCSAFWGIGCEPVDPTVRRGYGWQNPFWLTYNPRDSMTAETPLAKYRTVTELWLGASPRYGENRERRGARGIGRQGVDFWKVLKGNRNARRKAGYFLSAGSMWGSTIVGRYPESEWGHLNFARGVPYLFGPGKDGALPTIRSEAIRENLQEIEARVFIEKVLLDEGRKATLGPDLVRRCREVLDERTRMGLYLQYTSFNYRVQAWPWFVTDFERRTERLFRMAAEVAGKVR